MSSIKTFVTDVKSIISLSGGKQLTKIQHSIPSRALAVPTSLTLPFTCTQSVVHTWSDVKTSITAMQQYQRCCGAILTSSQMSRVCTLALQQPPCLFVFPEGAPPALGER